MDFISPDYAERKGSLLLRSQNMNYSRAVLNSNWHQAREAEPKDYDMSKHPVRNLKWSTYRRIANVTDGSLPPTTYQDFSRQVFLKPLFEEKDNIRRMVTLDTLKHTHIDRKEGADVLPHHHPDYNKRYLDTTHRSDYKSHFPLVSTIQHKKEKELPDLSPAYRKCISQFTDTTNHRRPGWNTWQDESGIYSNTHFKRSVFVPRNPIPEVLKWSVVVQVFFKTFAKFIFPVFIDNCTFYFCHVEFHWSLKLSLFLLKLAAGGCQFLLQSGGRLSVEIVLCVYLYSESTEM